MRSQNLKLTLTLNLVVFFRFRFRFRVRVRFKFRFRFRFRFRVIFLVSFRFCLNVVVYSAGQKYRWLIFLVVPVVMVRAELNF